jgi:predicted RNase H-like HicB family nuclease
LARLRTPVVVRATDDGCVHGATAASDTLSYMANARKRAASRRPVHRKSSVRRAATSLRYTVIYEPQPEGGYSVSVPALPGCITEGDTIAEARSMAEDAIRGYCESLLADGLKLPVAAR